MWKCRECETCSPAGVTICGQCGARHSSEPPPPEPVPQAVLNAVDRARYREELAEREAMLKRRLIFRMVIGGCISVLVAAAGLVRLVAVQAEAGRDRNAQLNRLAGRQPPPKHEQGEAAVRRLFGLEPQPKAPPKAEEP